MCQKDIHQCVLHGGSASHMFFTDHINLPVKIKSALNLKMNSGCSLLFCDPVEKRHFEKNAHSLSCREFDDLTRLRVQRGGRRRFAPHKEDIRSLDRESKTNTFALLPVFMLS